MREHSTFVSSLARLADEAKRLSFKDNCFTQEFEIWHQETGDLLRKAFPGQAISEDFDRIDFETPPELARLAAQQLKQFKDVPLRGNVDDGFFRKAMLRAEEIIRTGIYVLRRDAD